MATIGVTTANHAAVSLVGALVSPADIIVLSVVVLGWTTAFDDFSPPKRLHASLDSSSWLFWVRIMPQC